MATGFARRTRTTAGPFLCLICALHAVAVVPAGTQTSPPAQAETSTKRVADRIAALKREANALAGQQKTLLGELRALEIERQLKAEELRVLELESKTIEQAIADAGLRAARLRQSASDQQPDVEERLVRLYKMGRAGYWRLLLDVADVQSIGRAYRTAAALTRLDQDRVQRHQQTLSALDRERAELQARAKEAAALKTRLAAAQVALDRSVASRATAVESITSRRDLAGQLAAELDAAHLRLQSTLAQAPGAGGGDVIVPLRPFRGEMPWPADGIVVHRFGRQQAGRMVGIDVTRNGIELSLAEGHPVAAVHDGMITQAGPFPGYGQLVIVDHGGGAALALRPSQCGKRQ